jgi:Uma2 family endonuclease
MCLEPLRLYELVERLGVPLSRILAQPAPGTATEVDLLEAELRYNCLCELVDGVLVEKAVGFRESILAGMLGQVLSNFIVLNNLGVVTGPDGPYRLRPGLVRLPDVAFTSWDRLPDSRIPEEPIPSLAPDLAIEVLSKTNTPAEMKRKRCEYFDSGVQIVWEVEPKHCKVSVFAPEGMVTVRNSSQRLDGGDILPGFVLDVSKLFGVLDRHG